VTRHGTARHKTTARHQALAAASLAALLLTACAAQPAQLAQPASGTDSGGLAAGLAHARSAVAAYEAAGQAYPVPAQKLAGVAALHGKTVYYVPIAQNAPQFATTAATLHRALGSAGLKLRVCDGGSSPARVSACFRQAAHTRAGAIITDSIPYAMAANALIEAQQTGIPVLITDQVPTPAYPSSASLGYMEGPGATQLIAVADWIIADSGGRAKVLINMSTDSPSTISYVRAARTEFSAFCPDCTVVINKISSAHFAQIAASTRAALQANTGTGYVISEFEQYLQPTIGGIKQSGQAARIKLVSTAAELDGLQQLRTHGPLDAIVGQASAFQGWVDADAALRLMRHQPVQFLTIPVRLFTRGQLAGLPLTTGAEDSGEWFGPTSYMGQFDRLWSAG
jgi:ribose transport system substrate-binding protein